ncbi:2'-5' RNA ligase family protein [Sphingomonas crusticola]|uniref:2'-5' RNA ligase family protein n=1 Tax=Sphingomonas crusticola TaxID=1697973 RepID=UPI000E285FF8|nr:2'-5' RNA ligase family protein [Sphingomonas crusticola]
MSPEVAPLIVSALFGAQDFSWFDGLRRAHFPPERNQLPAHLTLFHHLPPSLAAELNQRLAEVTRGARPRADAAGMMNLGGGVAIRIASPGLSLIREDLADAFAGMLTPQDAAGWRPHVTIQNKVPPHQAKALYSAMAAAFTPRTITVEGLAVWRYRGGPWEPVARHKFRG